MTRVIIKQNNKEIIIPDAHETIKAIEQSMLDIQDQILDIIDGDISIIGYAKTSDIPTKVSDLDNDSGFLSSISNSDLPSIPTSKITGLATVATSGNYNDLNNKPTTMTPTSHKHGYITNEGTIGSAANLPIITEASGKLTTGSFGSNAYTFCEGNDPRLSDPRIPKSTEIIATVEEPYDLNSLTDTGFYFGNRGGQLKTINTPDDTHKSRYVLIVEAFGQTSSTDRKQTLTFTSNGKTYVRALREAGNWSNWVELTYIHPTGVAKTGNPNENKTLNFGTSFTITQFTSDAAGHITAATDRIISMPTLASITGAGLSASGGVIAHPEKTYPGDRTTAALRKITVDQYGHINTASEAISGSDLPSHNHTIANITNLQTSLDNKQDTSNIVQSISSSPSTTKYPSEKCIADLVGDISNYIIS